MSDILALREMFFNTIFVSSHMYPENPEGTQISVCHFKILFRTQFRCSYAREKCLIWLHESRAHETFNESSEYWHSNILGYLEFSLNIMCEKLMVALGMF